MMVASGATIGRPHEIAHLHRGHAGASGDRRADRAVGQLDLEVLDLGRGRARGGAPDVDLGPGVVELDLRGRVLGDQLGVALKIALVLLELRLGADQHRLQVADLRLDGAAVEREQQVALLHHGAVVEMHADDLGFEPRLDGDAGDRGHGAEQFDLQRHPLLFGDRDDDRHAARLRRSAAAPGRRLPADSRCRA